jgi:hypothetical protein
MSYYKAHQLYNRQSLPQSNLMTEVTVTGDRSPSEMLDIKYETVNSADTKKPEVFGPPYWFTLHNASANYPVKASLWCAQRMKGYILGIPVTLPCESCSDHATAFIESKRDKLDYIVSGRAPLFEFFVEFHNFVNKRLGKPIVSVKDAYKMYSSPANVTKMTYTFVSN